MSDKTQTPRYSLQDGDMCLCVADFSILMHYRENLYSEVSNVPIKVLTLKAMLKTIKTGNHFVVIPLSHFIALRDFTKTEGEKLELATFLNFCHIFPDSTQELDEAPIRVASICKVGFPKRNIFILTLNEKTKRVAQSVGLTCKNIPEAISALE